MEYTAVVRQFEHDKRCTDKLLELKIEKELLMEYLEKLIGTQSESPYASIQNIKHNELHFDTNISLKTVYNYLDTNLFLHISNKDLHV